MKILAPYTFICILFFSLSFTPAWADEKIPEKPVETSLQTFQYQDKQIFALSYKNAPHWHTYWKNPGDAGLPTEIKPENFKIEEFPWPVPQRFIEKGDILAYGYGGSYTRFFTLKETQGTTLKLTSNWLVCKHICIPGKVDIEANYADGLLTEVSNQDFILSNDELIKRYELLPQSSP